MRLTNTLSGDKEELEPIHQDEIRFYVCGPTVYDASHLGHARPIFVFDVLRRVLERKGLRVTQVINVTDIDDKIIRRAAEQNVGTQELSRKWEADYWDLFDKLGALRPHHAPRATEHISEMVSLVEALIAKDLAYPSGSDVYFNVRKFEHYGRLSGRSLDDMKPEEPALGNGDTPQGGEKKDQENLGKRDPLDFALWKGKKEGDPAWPSPWGEGRPGWHIECSAMSAKYLDLPFDIHGGALDLIFPHHENEIAQSEGARGSGFAKIWMHVGFLNVEGQKMSKSLGNVVSLRELIDKYPADILRLYFLQNHYRSPIDFSLERLDETAEAYERLEVYRMMVARLLKLCQDRGEEARSEGESEFGKQIVELEQRFQEALEEDLNTAKGLGILFEFARRSQAEILPWMQKGKLPTGPVVGLLEKGYKFFEEATGVLGLFLESGESPDDIKILVEKRSEARRSKDFALSDKLRDEITGFGYILEDHPVLGSLLRLQRSRRPGQGAAKGNTG